MAGINETIGNAVTNIKPFVIKHKYLLLAILVFLVLLMFGGSVQSTAEEQVASVERQLASINNEIAQYDSQKHEVQYVTKHIDHGLDTARWKSDDNIAAKWIEPAFSWRNSSEYIEHRDLYINRLSATDPFVTSFMAAYVPQYQTQHNENGNIDDGTHISCMVTSFNSYITKIDEDTGVYSYVAVLRCTTSIPVEYDYKGALQGSGNFNTAGVENTVILTYDMDASGVLSNFTAAMNNYSGYVPA